MDNMGRTKPVPWWHKGRAHRGGSGNCYAPRDWGMVQWCLFTIGILVGALIAIVVVLTSAVFIGFGL